jgi:uridylate kinase
VKYKRVLLKISGEALAGSAGRGIDPETARFIASEIRDVQRSGVQLGIVLGGGNIFRGLAGVADGFDRTVGDSAGMLATVINGLLFAEVLRSQGVVATVLTATSMEKIGEPFTATAARRYLDEGTVVIMAGGTGNPYFTTDTAAALRCAETKCDVLLKATKVDGIYEADPVTHPDAARIDSLSHQDALARGIRVMDSTAFSLCMDNDIPIIVFKLMGKGNLRRCVEGERVGSIVQKGA